MLVYIYLSYKVYRYKAKLAAKNVHAHTLASAIRGTTGLIATNVHHLQTINVQPLDRNHGNIAENENQRRKRNDFVNIVIDDIGSSSINATTLTSFETFPTGIPAE